MAQVRRNNRSKSTSINFMEFDWMQVRRQAEAALEHAKASAEAAVPALLKEACTNSSVDVRLMAAVVLKKWIPQTWEKLPADVRGSLKDALLKASVFAEGVYWSSDHGLADI
jgi:hypothetical protein